MRGSGTHRCQPYRTGWVIGGSFQEPSYAASNLARCTLLRREGSAGVRLVRPGGQPPAAIPGALPDLRQADRTARALQAVTDDVFASYAAPYPYQPGELNATEPRLKTAIPIGGGVPGAGLMAACDPIDFVPRIAAPVLMVNGRHDPIPDARTSRQPPFDLRGAPAADQRYVVADGGHSPPRADLQCESAGWPDQYLGPAS